MEWAGTAISNGAPSVPPGGRRTHNSMRGGERAQDPFVARIRRIVHEYRDMFQACKVSEEERMLREKQERDQGLRTKNISMRPDVKAGTMLVNKLKEAGEWEVHGSRPGAVAGIRVNDLFLSRGELRMVGMLLPPLAAMQTNWVEVEDGETVNVVSSLVMSGNYEDDREEDPRLEQIVWTGAGGIDLLGKRHQQKDQELRGSNFALTMNIKYGIPVRVCRKVNAKSYLRDQKGYVYIGLYDVTKHWEEKGKKGFKVHLYKLQRQPGQVPIDDAYLRITHNHHKSMDVDKGCSIASPGTPDRSIDTDSDSGGSETGMQVRGRASSISTQWELLHAIANSESGATDGEPCVSATVTTPAKGTNKRSADMMTPTPAARRPWPRRFVNNDEACPSGVASAGVSPPASPATPAQQTSALESEEPTLRRSQRVCRGTQKLSNYWAASQDANTSNAEEHNVLDALVSLGRNANSAPARHAASNARRRRAAAAPACAPSVEEPAEGSVGDAQETKPVAVSSLSSLVSTIAADDDGMEGAENRAEGTEGERQELACVQQPSVGGDDSADDPMDSDDEVVEISAGSVPERIIVDLTQPSTDNDIDEAKPVIAPLGNNVFVVKREEPVVVKQEGPAATRPFFTSCTKLHAFLRTVPVSDYCIELFDQQEVVLSDILEQEWPAVIGIDAAGPRERLRLAILREKELHAAAQAST